MRYSSALVFISVTLLLNVTAAFAAPTLDIRWHFQSHEQIDVEFRRDETFISDCVESGLELRVRFKLHLCERRTLWFDDCSDDWVSIHSLTLEPISQKYRLRSDLLGDQEEAEEQTFEDFEEARLALLRLEGLRLDELNEEFSDPASFKGRAVSARVHSYCKGDYNLTLARISETLTFGIVDFGGVDTGWVDFALK